MIDFVIEFDLSSFFFFQAEDGIRDLTVTGVQTCALPISSKSVKEAASPRSAAKRAPVALALKRSPCRARLGSGTVFKRAFMEGPTVCVQCDLPEDRCTCEKYCTICKGQHNIRLCADGLYYCPDCREACDVALASSRGR